MTDRLTYYLPATLKQKEYIVHLLNGLGRDSTGILEADMSRIEASNFISTLYLLRLNEGKVRSLTMGK